MKRKLYIGFKGKNNASCILAKNLSENCHLLTNSFNGIKRDIETLNTSYDYVVLFGIDKSLKNSVRVERVAEKETLEFSALNLENIAKQLDAIGISNCISDKPTHYLCNNAYWHLLKKFNRNVVLIHIPTNKNINECFLERLVQALK